MTVTVLLITFGLLSALLLVLYTRRRTKDLSSFDSLSQDLEPVPVSALLNLIDPGQGEYLERKLAKSDFVCLQRMRNRALFQYFRTIYRNAGILLQLAHAAVESPMAEVADAGRELTEHAMLARTLALRALVRLAIARVVPAAAADLISAVNRYVIATARSTSLVAILAGQRASA